MIFRCKCGLDISYNIHKDGLEVVNFICNECRRKTNYGNGGGEIVFENCVEIINISASIKIYKV